MPFFFWDPTQIIVVPALLFALWAQFKVQRTFARYSEVPASSGYTGAQVATELLRRRGITDVTVEETEGMLSDHYDPRAKVLRLSPQVYESTSIAAIGVAAHETGHALQDREGYAPLALRSAFVPVASVGTWASWILFLIGLVLRSPALMNVGILIFVGYLLFALVTLPVEFDASARAVRVLQGEGLVMPQEADGVRAVLSAAGLTYVAAAAMAVLQLIRLLVLRNMSEE